MVRAAVVVSGDGAEVQSLLDGMFFGEIPGFTVAALVCTDPESGAPGRGERAHVPVYTVDSRIFPNRATFTRALTSKLLDLDVDAAVAVTLSPEPGEDFYRAFAGRCICLRLTRGEGRLTAAAMLADADGSEARRFGRVTADERGVTDEAAARRALAEAGAGELLTDAVKKYMREYHG